MRRRPSSLRLAAVVTAFAATLTGCEGSGDPDPDRGPPSAPSPVSPEQALRLLDELRDVVRHPSVPSYARDAFGSAWADTDGNGCNQRDDVLLRDAVPGSTRVQRQDACPHDVLAGTWIDPYTGHELVFDDLKDPAQAQAVQIDHVVPLAEAWLSGASAWTDERRLRFANDLAGLVASDGPTNASKGADDPAAWRPRQPFQCAYATRWVSVKHQWGLAVDTSERSALAEMLSTC